MGAILKTFKAKYTCGKQRWGCIFEKNNHLIQARILCKICDFQFLGQILSLKKSIFFKHMKIAMKCALVMKYCFRLLKIDSKHLFLMKYHDSGDFQPSGSMLKNVIFRYFCQINNVHIVQYKILFPLSLPKKLMIKKYGICAF